MADNLPNITLKAIGTVSSEITQPKWHVYKRVVADIVVNRDLTEALDGLEQFSHIIVLYWMHLVVADGTRLKLHPRGRQELPLVGLFATRTPTRPSQIGMTVVRLLERRGNLLRVEGLDAIDGTPVIDLKPYIPGNDSVADARVPPWITSR